MQLLKTLIQALSETVMHWQLGGGQRRGHCDPSIVLRAKTDKDPGTEKQEDDGVQVCAFIRAAAVPIRCLQLGKPLAKIWKD